MKVVAVAVWVALCVLVTCFMPQISPLIRGWIALLATVLIFIPYRANFRAPE